MHADEMAGVRGLHKELVQEVFASLPQKDQRGMRGLYLQGLMLDGKRKSMQPIGERLSIDSSSCSSSFPPCRTGPQNAGGQGRGPDRPAGLGG